VLKEVCRYIREHFKRATDVKVRDGGDELMIIMPNTPHAGAAKVAEAFEGKMRIGVSEKPVTAQQLADNFTGTVEKLAEMPRVVRAEGGTTHEQLAEQLLKHRMPMTGEQISPEKIGAEAMRLRERTGIATGEFKSDLTFTAYTNDEIAGLADKASFRFLPQIGQFLKRNGVNEDHIAEAVRIQAQTSTGRRPLLGEILVDNGLCTKDKVDIAFAEQGRLRQNLLEMMRGILGSQRLQMPISYSAFPAILDNPAQVAAFRQSIPDVHRPSLDPNGVRRLSLFEMPVAGEVVVGASTGVVELLPAETAAAFKHRGDKLMLEKKKLREEQGLRSKRN